MNTLTQEQNTRLAEAVAELATPLFRFAVMRGLGREDAEDVVQEAFVRFATAGPVTNTKAYLYRAVANGVTDLLRRRRPHAPLSEQMAAETENTPDQQETERIGRLLGHLTDEQAEVVRLHTFASLRFTEIAEVLDTPVTTVKSRFRAAIERLRPYVSR